MKGGDGGRLDPLVGLTVGQYRVVRPLAEGGMARVYLAEDLKHRRQVAMKVVRSEIAEAIGVPRFLREIEIAARLNHPHILPLFDSGEAGGQLFYVMPHIEGETLRARLLRDGPLPLEEALRLAHQIASALGHAHHRGLVHRDIKPENVLISDGLALVADFGIARAAAESGGDGATRVGTGIGLILGTPGYMSPEQAGGGEVDARTDVYALACVLYEMLAGRPPFTATTAEGVVRQHLSVEAAPLTQVSPSVPDGVSRVIAKALAKLPADRYATAARFTEALGVAVSGGPGPVPAADTTAAEAPNNLPRPRTTFVGRESVVSDCSRLLEESRLLTLTGIGGAGKTRLAIRIAGGQLGRYPDGVWFAELAPLTEAERVAETVADAVGLREEAGKSLVEALKRHARARRMLVVLDNCEHLLSACAEVADALLSAGPGVRILATSREGLGVEGERLFALRSLAVPPESAATDVRAVETSEAARLFVDRARLASPGFALDGRNAGAVAEICRRLDGIPLAIELAAARTKILSVDQIRARLDDRFRLLAGGSRTALPRQQTLRATLQWSYDQLTAEEQRQFRVLSVFAGGCTLDSAARVAGEDADEFEVMDLLSRLVEKSLLSVERDAASEHRYAMLDTVRQYGQERLAEAGEADAARSRHLAEFKALAERAYGERFVREEKWASVLETEHDNLRVALSTARGSDPERYLELAGALAWFWQARTHLGEGRGHLTAAVTAAPSRGPRPALARALWGAASSMAWQGDAAAGLPWMEEALRLWRILGDRGEVALALEGLGMTQLLAGNDEAARIACEESLRLQREGGDPVLVNRAAVALAQVLVGLEDLEPARALAKDIIAFSRAHDDRRSEHFGLHYLADCALIEGTCADSLELYRESLALATAIGDRLETSFEVQGVAMSLAGLADHAGAIRLASAAAAEWERIGADVHMGFWDRLMEQYLGRAREALGAEAAERASREGRALPFEEAIALASGARDARGGTRGSPAS